MGTSKTTQDLTEEKKLLELYKELRTELRMQIQASNKRATNGLAVIGAVIGYALYSDSPALISAVPFILGILFIDRIIYSNEVRLYARHLIDIEQELSEPGSSFRYELLRGGAYGSERADPNFLGLPSPRNPFYLPNYVKFATLAVSYFSIIVSALFIWLPNHPILGSHVGIIFVAYSMFTIFLAVVGFYHYILRQRLRDSIDQSLREELRQSSE